MIKNVSRTKNIFVRMSLINRDLGDVIGFVDWTIDIICCECGRCCLSLRCDKKTLVTV